MGGYSMSTGDVTWQCQDTSGGCTQSFSGGIDYVTAQAIDHAKVVHSTDITAEEVQTQSSAPEA
jgi:hypothetical protein